MFSYILKSDNSHNKQYFNEGFMTNIKMIARKAGVSIATVSRVMNGSKPVSSDLQERVFAAVEQLNYKPNSIARSLILNKTNLIGVVVPDVSNGFQARILAGIESYSAQTNYRVIICNVYHNLKYKKNYLSILLDRHVDGIILLHETGLEEIEAFQKNSRVPLVFASVQTEGSNIPFVGIDEVGAARDAVRYMVGKGHQSVGLIYGEGTALGHLRRNGYLDALGEAGIEVDYDYMIQTCCGVDEGYEAMGKLLALPQRPSAIFCVSDEMAVGAMNKALDLGLRVPEDISIMGFDDIDLSRVVRPKLTTVHQPIETIGIEAARHLIALIESKGNAISAPLILPHSIVERETLASVTPTNDIPL